MSIKITFNDDKYIFLDLDLVNLSILSQAVSEGRIKSFFVWKK